MWICILYLLERNSFREHVVRIKEENKNEFTGRKFRT